MWVVYTQDLNLVDISIFMSLLLIYWVVISLCTVVVFISQPYLLGLILLTTSMFVCMLIGVSISTFLGFLVFMSYVGGLMVLFVYVLSVFPNEFYDFKAGSLGLSMLFISLVFFMFSGLVSKVNLLSTSGGAVNFHYMSFSCYWDVFVFMALFLLLIMMCVSYLVMKKRMPLRSI
nr:NADH dehydrogenase subunit 6 [Mytella strigata]